MDLGEVHLQAHAPVDGERAGLDYDAVADVLFAPIYYRLMFAHQPLTDGLPAEIMAVCWPGIAPSEEAQVTKTE